VKEKIGLKKGGEKPNIGTFSTGKGIKVDISTSSQRGRKFYLPINEKRWYNRRYTTAPWGFVL